MVQAMQEVNLKQIKLKELKHFKSSLRIEEQLQSLKIMQKVAELKKQLEEQCCAKDPNAFWHIKQ